MQYWENSKDSVIVASYQKELDEDSSSDKFDAPINIHVANNRVKSLLGLAPAIDKFFNQFST